ncbi:G-D-S-L family lipolytic protein [Tenacibaculum sp. S7007]|uniref:G-D-S-L family lipolytic protein n=1 Tax=Tenacibaculum pelagium TaxID=2759527 RepID=A0A839ANZ0_9FLAO|nr:G-D-S-L family lipolytic protein [Tenacibaculum pelagium]MBA6156216.1 G-D-S-L family lipolytic protein [Tenacibaculum pelagium]
MKNTFKYTFLSALFLGFVACDTDDVYPPITDDTPINNIQLDAGSADFSNYVALGASFTAGFTDNALFIAGQENSFPNTMAKKFAMVGGGTFTQPLMNDNYGGLILFGNPVLTNPLDPESRIFTERLVFDGKLPAPLNELNPLAMSTTDFALNNPTGPFKNLGVPGAKSTHFIAPGYGNLTNFPAAANPYAIRVLGNSDTSLMAAFENEAPTFFTLSEFGGNDVLGYATSGGDGSNPITPDATFDFALNLVKEGLLRTGAKGVVANLPYITSLPHFTTVPHDALDPTTNAALASQVPLLNTVYGAINQIYAGAGEPERAIMFDATKGNPIVIFDEDATDLRAAITTTLSASPTFVPFVQSLGLPAAAAPLVAQLLGEQYGFARSATENDLFVLTSLSEIGEVDMTHAGSLIAQSGGLLPATLAGQFSAQGVTLPLADKWVLTPQEQEEIKTAVDSYNGKLKALADANGYAFVDFKAILQQASTTGLEFDNQNMNTSLITGGLVGLDGIHLTARGYALMANKMLEAIDVTYGSNFATAKDGLAKAENYPTNYSPALQ